MSSREVVQLLCAHGYIIFFHPDKRRTVPVPMGKKDLPVGTINAIMKQAGLKVE